MRSELGHRLSLSKASATSITFATEYAMPGTIDDIGYAGTVIALNIASFGVRPPCREQPEMSVNIVAPSE